MRGSQFVFNYVQLLYYKCHKINFICGGSYIDSRDWIKNKKVTTNPVSKKDSKCFQYLLTLSFNILCLNYKEIGKNTERTTKIKLFINKYNWEGINFPSEKVDWKKFEKNNVTIALNVLYVKKEKIYPAYVSKHNLNREKQVILLMVVNGEKWYYLAVKKLKIFLRGMLHIGEMKFIAW